MWFNTIIKSELNSRKVSFYLNVNGKITMMKIYVSRKVVLIYRKNKFMVRQGKGIFYITNECEYLFREFVVMMQSVISTDENISMKDKIHNCELTMSLFSLLLNEI